MFLSSSKTLFSKLYGDIKSFLHTIFYLFREKISQHRDHAHVQAFCGPLGVPIQRTDRPQTPALHEPQLRVREIPEQSGQSEKHAV